MTCEEELMQQGVSPDDMMLMKEIILETMDHSLETSDLEMTGEQGASLVYQEILKCKDIMEKNEGDLREGLINIAVIAIKTIKKLGQITV